MSFVTAAPRPHGFHEPVQGTADISQHHHHFGANGNAMNDPSKNDYYNQQLAPQLSCEIKPRLTKEQHDILESHFQKQNKPNTQTKKSFADSLNVSLDKVNNWFQNRRAKSKQDAKKLVGSVNILTGSQTQSQQSTSSSTPNPTNHAGSLSSSASSSGASPVFTSDDYFGVLQHCPSDEQLSNSMTISQAQQFQEQSSSSSSEHSWSYASDSSLDHLNVPQRNLFDSAHDNRKTLTQEQFDAFAVQNGGFMRASHDMEDKSDVLDSLFPDMDFKNSDHLTMLRNITPSISSHDSSLPSSISEQSLFTSSTGMHDFSSISSSDWNDSRSSSVSSMNPHDHAFVQQMTAAMQPSSNSSQWQPGQSIPVDATAQYQQFREAAQARQMQPQQSQSEQPLSWPSDDAFTRRESQSSVILAQQMSNFGLQTPAPQQDGAFKTPPPPASIAARRQRPRPAALGLASLRSQSYSGAGQSASPGQNGVLGQTANAPQLRRIRSSNVLGGVAPGRVMKSTPGSGQRSPLSWTFADGMVSPKALRHSSSASISSLAPPTPMSPREVPAPTEQSRPQFPPWQSSFGRQASISETDDEHAVPLPMTSGLQQNFSSPPHTPMYHQHSQPSQHLQQSIAMGASSVTTENTPPQSAPAIQQTFPSSAYMLPQQMQAQQHAGSYMAAPHHAQQFQMSSMPSTNIHQFVTPVPMQAHDMQMQFAQGVPVVDAHGNFGMAFPSQMQFVQQGAQPQHKHSQSHSQFGLIPPSYHQLGGLSAMPHAQKPSQPAAELLVHEYNPPSDVKRAATPRKIPADSGPKNYTFANQGPEHFEKERAKKATSDSKPSGAAASESPSNASS